MRALVDRYRGQVFGLCYRMLGHRQDAEDTAQETFVRVLKHLDRWDKGRDFEPWLLAVAGNRCRTVLAARRKRTIPRPLNRDLADESADPREARNLAEEVQRSLGELRADYRQAFILFHENGLSYAEIAEAMARPLGTVKTWVHRARKQLFARLAQRGVVEESHRAVQRV